MRFYSVVFLSHFELPKRIVVAVLTLKGLHPTDKVTIIYILTDSQNINIMHLELWVCMYNFCSIYNNYNIQTFSCLAFITSLSSCSKSCSFILPSLVKKLIATNSAHNFCRKYLCSNICFSFLISCWYEDSKAF